MNNQEAFNKIWERAKIPRKALSPGGCVYRAPDGLKCFVGELIPDDQYESGLEGHNARELCRMEECPSVLRGLDVTFLTVCQGIHDAYTPDMWAARLRMLAKSYGLTVPE